jgi:hypothetical protein
MSILPQQRPMSQQYTAIVAVVYLALAGYMAYRGYVEHRNFLYVLAAVLVFAAAARVFRSRKTTQQPRAQAQDKKVELFSKPKDF